MVVASEGEEGLEQMKEEICISGCQFLF